MWEYYCFQYNHQNILWNLYSILWKHYIVHLWFHFCSWKSLKKKNYPFWRSPRIWCVIGEDNTMHGESWVRTGWESCFDSILKLFPGLRLTMLHSIGRKEADWSLCLKGHGIRSLWSWTWLGAAQRWRRKLLSSGGLNLECKPTQVSGGWLCSSLIIHHENHLKWEAVGEERGGLEGRGEERGVKEGGKTRSSHLVMVTLCVTQ